MSAQPAITIEMSTPLPAEFAAQQDAVSLWPWAETPFAMLVPL